VTPATTRSREFEVPSTARPRGALGLTLDPVTPEAFLDEYCERRPLVVARDEAGRFDSVLSDADLERLVCASAIRAPAFRLVKDGSQLPPSTYTTDIAWRPGSFSRTALVDRVAQEHAAGATIVLQALHLHWHPAALYCRELEAWLGWPVQANAYCTPASSQGFGVHHDTHDVFVLQVSGHKRWRVYAPVVELPLKTQRWSPGDAQSLGAAVHDITLQAGDTLYLPRGWPHEATAADADSLHITVGLHPPTRIDALRAALSECADDVEFRRVLPAGGEVPGELLARLAARLEPDAVARRARRGFVDGRRAILDGQLTQIRALKQLTLRSALQRRPTVIADFERSATGRRCASRARRCAFRRRRSRPSRRLTPPARPSRPPSFRVRWMPRAGLVLVKRLVREGFLRLLDP